MPKKYTRKNKKYRRCKKGGVSTEIDDIELGKMDDIPYMKTIPPDPKRFEKLEKTIYEKNIERPLSPVEATAIFNEPTPEEREKIEGKKMFTEDPLYAEPFEKEELKIFESNGGKKRRHSKKNRRYKRKSISRRRN
jgi:hypothetical protein